MQTRSFTKTESENVGVEEENFTSVGSKGNENIRFGCGQTFLWKQSENAMFSGDTVSVLLPKDRNLTCLFVCLGN